ncbi:MAG: DEAD/DEAH box helicase [Halofilum sp. (in: g-proteobacteria)]|nr:DEAD/DEAH box helicase [Halofilum sp. (in: g-proteobacteria)]
MSFDELGLSAALVSRVHDHGYHTPTPIQQQAIPVVLAGGDLLATAQTGTGKTAGFTLPLLDLLNRSRPAGGGRPVVRALIVTPTRELAAQVHDSVKTYGRDLPLRSMTIFGGVGMQPQVSALRRGVDILVATPGRLLDHMRQGTVDLSRVEILVLDEADRMLDMGFIRDIRRVISALPATRQTLLFSATFSTEIRQLAQDMLHQPARIDVARRNTAAEAVTQLVHPVNRNGKAALLTNLINTGDWQQVLVFTRTKHGADRLAVQLDRDGVTATAIHGNKSQGARTRALARFKQGGVRVLVATDIAARGLDIDQLPHVVNYDLPHVPEDYVHRIGRTGRAGRGGQAVSLVCADEHKLLHGIEKLLDKRITQQAVAGHEPDPAERPQPIARQNRGGKPANGARRAHKPAAANPAARRDHGHQSPTRKPRARR